MFSTFRDTTLAAIVAGLGLLAAGGAKASVITYDITITGSSGPQNGTVEHGKFSFSSSSSPPGGGAKRVFEKHGCVLREARLGT